MSDDHNLINKQINSRHLILAKQIYSKSEVHGLIGVFRPALMKTAI